MGVILCLFLQASLFFRKTPIFDLKSGQSGPLEPSTKKVEGFIF